MEVYLICIATSLIGGLALSRLSRRLHMPAVTAYLIAGLLLGPFCLGSLNVPGMGFNSLEQVEGLHIITQTALGFIAFTIGNEFRAGQLKAIGAEAVTIGIMQAVIATVVVDIALIALHFVRPDIISVPCALVLGAIASATAPAATLMVIRQYKADGPMTRLLMLVVAIDDAVGLLLFSLSYGVAQAIGSGRFDITAIVIEPVAEITLSLVLGSIMGGILSWYERFFHSRGKRLSVSVSFVVLTVGLSSVKFTVGGIHCGFSLLLVCMMTGTVFCNTCPTSEELMDRIDRWVTPLNIMFFVLSGAELDLAILTQPVTILIGVVYIAARSAGKYYGAVTSCTLTHQPKPITQNLGITLLPQAGVALGMALTAANLPDGTMVRNVILFSVLVYELVGPYLTKMALLRVGEIKPEQRKSARKHNPSLLYI